MWRTFRTWLFDSIGPQKLPERVQAAIQRQQEQSEILIAWVQLVIVALLAVAYETTTMPDGVVQLGYLETTVLALYAVFGVIRMALA